MKKITLFISFIFSGIIFSQTLEMPNIPAEGVNYETLTFDSYLTIPTTGPWDFSNIAAQFQESDIEMIPIASTEYSGQYPNSTHVKTSMFGTQLVEQFPGFTESGYTYNGENSVIITNYSTPLVLHPYPLIHDAETANLLLLSPSPSSSMTPIPQELPSLSES